MTIECGINSIKKWTKYSENLIDISGWCLDENGKAPDLLLMVDNQEILCTCRKSIDDEILKTAMGGKYAGKAIPCAFHITARYKSDMEKSISIVAADMQGNQEIYSISKEDLHLHTINSSLLNNLEKYEYDQRSGICRISGWMISLLNEIPQFVITDCENHIIESSMHYEYRNDIVWNGYVSEDGKRCGYVVQFMAADASQYRLIVKTESDEDTVSFTPSRPAAKPGFMKSLIMNINLRTIKKAWMFLRRFGLKNTLKRLKQGYQSEKGYDDWFRANRISELELEKQKTVRFSFEPKISIIVPTFNTPIDLLDEMIQSVLNQSYSNWELCIADASAPDSKTREAILKYQNSDERITVNLLTENYGISGNTNKALDIATGEYCGLLDHDDMLEPDALFEVVKKLNEYSFDSLYTDEDKYEMEISKYSTPHFKTDFAIDTLTSHNYITHFFVARTSIIREVGGEHSEYDGAQDYDLILRCAEKSNAVGHIAKILYHWRIHPGSTAGNPEQKLYCYESGRKAIQDHLIRTGIKGSVRLKEKPYWGFYKIDYEIIDEPLVSIIIPNCENKKLLETCLNSIFDVNTYPNIEIIIVENNSKSEEIFAYYEMLTKTHSNVKVVKWTGGTFNYSAVNNYGVRYASGEYLLFLNNDTKLINPDSIKEMLGVCMRRDVGAVGAKLLYPDNTVQHAGVVVGLSGSAGHVFLKIPKDDPGYFMRTIINCNFSAVTGACLMTKKTVFEEVGGLDESFTVALNDVDYCLKLRKNNRTVVFTPYSLWYHYESVTRQYEMDMKRIRRFDSEIALFQEKWNDVLMRGDPFYNSNFKSDAHLYDVR